MKKNLLFLIFLWLTFSVSVNAQTRGRKYFANPTNKKNTSIIAQRYGTLNTQSVSGIIREGFENASFPPVGWQTVNVSGPEVFLRSTLLPHSGIASAFCLYEQNASY